MLSYIASMLNGDSADTERVAKEDADGAAARQSAVDSAPVRAAAVVAEGADSNVVVDKTKNDVVDDQKVTPPTAKGAAESGAGSAKDAEAAENVEEGKEAVAAIKKEGVEGEVVEEEEEEEETCGFCKFMKGGSCKLAFVGWEACVDSVKEENGDFVTKCQTQTEALRDCMLTDPAYYGDMLPSEGEGEESGEGGEENEAAKSDSHPNTVAAGGKVGETPAVDAAPPLSPPPTPTPTLKQ
jgi:hypothetical protein